MTSLVESRVFAEVDAPIQLALDETDRLLGRDWQTDFFAMLRIWHNNRWQEGWDRLDLALVIATEPYLLVASEHQSPFNVGEVVALPAFDLAATEELNRRYGEPLRRAECTQLHQLLHGQPYLTRVALHRVVTPPGLPWARLDATADHDDGPFADHLKALTLRLTKAGLGWPCAAPSAEAASRTTRPHEVLPAPGCRARGRGWQPGCAGEPALRPLLRPRAPGADRLSAAAARLQVGGTLVPDRDLYIPRPEDEELFAALREREYVNIVSSRQVGKSSAMVRAALQLRAEGWRFAVVDLTSLGTPPDADGYFQGLIKGLAAGLKLKLDVPAFWAAHAGDTASQRLIAFFRDVVLTEIDGPVAIFLDEIDSTLKLPYTDDLFTALRAIYNERTLVEAWRRLVFCLVGVATPNELVKDRRTTPYNVGRTIWVGDFDPARDDLATPGRGPARRPGQPRSPCSPASSTGPAATPS